jgi:hypothetical protein
MPKGATSKLFTLGYTTYHRCVCGYDIENASEKLVAMKKKLHRMKCDEWKKEDVNYINNGIVDLPPGVNQHNYNPEKSIKMREEKILKSLSKK